MPFVVLNYVIHTQINEKSRNFASVHKNFLLMDKEDIKEIKRILYVIAWFLFCLTITISVQGIRELLR